ncbi:MAG: endo-1,4-beta-xylanase [Bacteroidota bacterium]
MLFVYEQLGKEYLAKAFHYAHEADPEAKLFYNDYSLSTDQKKRETTKIWLDSLRTAGVPIHGIGLQMHIGINDNQAEIQTAIESFASDGYVIHLSEIDISMNRADRRLSEPTDKKLAQQAEMMRFVKQVYDELSPELQYGLTFWGIGDDDSWIPGWFNREDYPLLFDQSYQPKPMYCTMWD